MRIAITRQRTAAASALNMRAAAVVVVAQAVRARIPTRMIIPRRTRIPTRTMKMVVVVVAPWAVVVVVVVVAAVALQRSTRHT